VNEVSFLSNSIRTTPSPPCHLSYGLVGVVPEILTFVVILWVSSFFRWNKAI